MAESLQFSIGADTKSFNDGISGMLASLGGLVAAFVSAQAIISAFSDAIDMGGRLHDLSTRTGETAGNLAILERAFEQTSVGAEKLGPAISKMQQSMVDMQQGNDKAVAAFTQLGLTWDDLSGKAPTEQMALIGERLAAIYDPALRAGTAVDIFGKSGAELLPILMNFSAETEEAKRQLGSLPQQLDASAFSVDSLGDNLSAISNKLTEMAYGFISEVVPALDVFTSKLAGVDAAQMGANLANILVGAFVEPMKTAELLGDVLIVGAKNYGNTLISTAEYFYDLIVNTMEAFGVSTGLVGTNLIDGAKAFGDLMLQSLADVVEDLQGITSIMGMLGIPFASSISQALSELNINSDSLDQLYENALSSVSTLGTKVRDAFGEAYEKTQFMVKDWLDAEGSTEQMRLKMEEIKEASKDAVDAWMTPIDSSDMAAGRTTTGTGTDPLISLIANENLVNQQAVAKGETVKTKSAAQIQAELNKQLSTIAAAAPTQAIGQSYSAQKVLDQQKELDTLTAQGKGNTAAADALRTSIQLNKDIVSGISLTSADQYAAQSWAMDEYLKGTSTMTLDQLEELAEQNILERKRADDKTAQAEQEAKSQEAGAGAKPTPAASLQSIVQAIQGILQKIEPKIPTHVMS